MERSKRSSWFRRVERLLLVSSFLCLAVTLIIAARAGASLRLADNIGQATLSQNGDGGGTTPPQQDMDALALSSEAGEKPSVFGRLEIPAIKLTVPLMSGDDSSSLLKGVGHIPGTAMPGGLGNAGLAGHRDMYLRPLKGIQPNMDIKVVDKTGTYHYQVDSTEIVTPDQVRVLDINSRPELTLVTCYPFYYVGNAPKRFIVHAHLLSALPDSVQ